MKLQIAHARFRASSLKFDYVSIRTLNLAASLTHSLRIDIYRLDCYHSVSLSCNITSVGNLLSVSKMN